MLRRGLVSLALLVTACGLTACGVRSTVDPVADAATRSSSSGGVAMTMSMTLTAPGTSITVSGHGRFEQQQGEMEIDFSDVLRQTGASLSTGSSAKEVFVTEDGDPVIYFDFPFLHGMLPGGKSWIRMDLEKAGKALGVDFNQLMTTSQNPAQSLELLKSSGDFSEVGTETIDGVSTTHYRGVVDLEEAAKARWVSSDLVERLIALGAPAQLPMDAWIDGAGYVRQIKQRYDQTMAGKSASVELTVGLSDFGMPVSISAPPADQVLDATDLATEAAQLHPNGEVTG